MFLAALALALATGVAPAAPAPVAPAAAPAVSPAALELARRLEELTEPRATLIASNLVAWEATARRGLSINATVQKLEQAYPGVTQAGLEAARPIARTYCEELVGKLQEARAVTYAGAMSEAELRQAIAFMQTPVAQRVLQRMRSNVDPNPLIDSVARQANAGEKVVITAEQAARIDREAARKTQAQVSAEDQVALMRFSQTPAGRKYVAARAASDVRLLELANAENSALIEKQGQAMEAGMVAFIDRKKAH